MSFPTSLSGTGYKGVSIPTKSPQQMDLYNFLMGGATQGLRGGGFDFLSGLAGGDQGIFDKLEAPAYRQFNEQIGNLANRFSGAGSGARQSGAFNRATGGAAADFAERLQSQRVGLQQSAIEQLMGLSKNLLGQNLFENPIIPKKKPFWQELLVGATPGIAEGISKAGTTALLAALLA